MNTPTTLELERTLQRYGSDLYRLALLLSDSAAQAEELLIAATRHVASSGGAPGEAALIVALAAGLPGQKPAWARRRLPEWARPHGRNAEHAPLLAAVARLPHPARLALGLAMLRAYEPEQIGPLLGGDEHSARAQIRDALQALAPHAGQPLPGVAANADAPEDCRPTRAALALADPRIHTDSTIRGHLAMCSACRAAEQSWIKLSASVEETLRAALRDQWLPHELAGQLQKAAQPPSGMGERRWLNDPRVRTALVIAPVLALIALMVWPRGTSTPRSGAASGADVGTAPAPIELVRRATAQLYLPPDGSGTWHSTYEIQWSFPNDSYALLNADEWLDAAGGRHRLQLVHHAGGGPYEYELADGTQSAWYAASESYAGSIYPLNANGAALRVQLQTTPEQRAQMLQARLRSGAWAIAGQYLRQAETAELRTWGRQRDDTGRLIDLVSFSGTSPLALPPDAPGATTSRVTILLAIDEASGRLREVRELFGAAGAEQTARTTWRVASEEWIAEAETANQIFDQRRAWNGVGEFADLGERANPAMPLLSLDTLATPTMLLRVNRDTIWMPATPPAGTTSAMLLYQTPGDLGLGVGADFLTLVYAGGAQQAAIRSVMRDDQIYQIEQGETITVNHARALLKPLPAQGYLALVFQGGLEASAPQITQVRTTGYTRAELVALLQSLAPPTLAAMREQAPLFAERRPHDAAWQALIGALIDPPQPVAGGARHFVEQVFKRQFEQPGQAARIDALADPYHRLPYSGWPAMNIQDNWTRGSAISGTLETATITRGADGNTYARQYRSKAHSWDYDATSGRVSEYAGPGFAPGLNEDQYTVFQMIECGGAQLQDAADGTRTVVLVERNWHSGSCQNPRYNGLWGEQNDQAIANRTAESPYVADIADSPLTTVITIGANGRPARTAVWAGAPESGTLLQSWERVSEELLPPDEIPADVFLPRLDGINIRLVMPPADVIQPIDTALPPTTDLNVAVQSARSPFFGFDNVPGAPQLVTITMGNQPEQVQSTRFEIDNSVFNAALNDGYAIYSTYSISSEAGLQNLNFYQGAARELGAYLRDMAVWSGSAATTVQVGGQTLSAWQVVEQRDGAAWLLFEIDGTLIAVDKPTPEALAVLDRLQRLDTALSPTN